MNPRIHIYLGGTFMTTTRKHKSVKEAIAAWQKNPTILGPYGDYPANPAAVMMFKVTAKKERSAK